MNTKHVCPRRREIGRIPSNYPDDDTWNQRDGFWHCSWCGSIHPDDLLQIMQTNGELGPTDKNYKVYVKTSDKRQSKFYFQHLDVAQRLRFIELYNAKPRAFTIGYPGHFYVLPFFVAYGTKEVSDDN
jgi:hypothetical protein